MWTVLYGAFLPVDRARWRDHRRVGVIAGTVLAAGVVALSTALPVAAAPPDPPRAGDQRATTFTGSATTTSSGTETTTTTTSDGATSTTTPGGGGGGGGDGETGGGNLAETGASVRGPLLAGAALLVLGTVLLFAVRGRGLHRG